MQARSELPGCYLVVIPGPETVLLGGFSCSHDPSAENKIVLIVNKICLFKKNTNRIYSIKRCCIYSVFSVSEVAFIREWRLLVTLPPHGPFIPEGSAQSSKYCY